MTDTKKVKKPKRLIAPDTKELKLLTNPLSVTDFTIYINKSKYWKKDATGKAVEMESELEAARITKVYIKSANRINVFNMDIKARDLFHWVTYNIESGEDFIWINYPRYMQEARVSLNTYKSALIELIDANLLAISKIKGVYWLNPRYKYNGSRVNKYRNALKISKPKKKPPLKFSNDV